jgi:hypothetical protein
VCASIVQSQGSVAIPDLSRSLRELKTKTAVTLDAQKLTLMGTNQCNSANEPWSALKPRV